MGVIDVAWWLPEWRHVDHRDISSNKPGQGVTAHATDQSTYNLTSSAMSPPIHTVSHVWSSLLVVRAKKRTHQLS